MLHCLRLSGDLGFPSRRRACLKTARRKGRRFSDVRCARVCTARSCSSEQRLEGLDQRSVFPTKVRLSGKTKVRVHNGGTSCDGSSLDDMLAVAKSLAASEQRMERCAASGSVRSEPTEAVESPSCAFLPSQVSGIGFCSRPDKCERCSLRRAAAKPKDGSSLSCYVLGDDKTRALFVGPSSVMEVRRATSMKSVQRSYHCQSGFACVTGSGRDATCRPYCTCQLRPMAVLLPTAVLKFCAQADSGTCRAISGYERLAAANDVERSVLDRTVASASLRRDRFIDGSCWSGIKHIPTWLQRLTMPLWGGIFYF